MILLTLQNMSKSFVMNEVLKDVNLTLQAGSRMGLVGVNGSGKSTLFRIISGAMEPDSGTVSLVKGTRVGVLTQDADIQSDLTIQQELERVFEPVRQMEARLRDMEAEMAEVHDDPDAFEQLSNAYSRLMDRFEDAGGYEWPSRIQGVLAGLGFARGRETQPANLLSGGEKTRLCLARLLLTQPELLMLDEPTNHLDLASTQWLEETLKKYRGTVLVISHDRYFLNAVCDCMAELSMKRLTQYAGNYDRFAVQRQANLERQLKEYKLQQAEIARQEAIIARYRMYNREKSIKAAESREKRLEKLERIEKPVSEQKVRFNFTARRRTGDDVLMVKDLSKGFEGRTLFEHFDLHLRAGDRVAVIGPNGVGKSTLLNIIAGQAAPGQRHGGLRQQRGPGLLRPAAGPAAPGKGRAERAVGRLPPAGDGPHPRRAGAVPAHRRRRVPEGGHPLRRRARARGAGEADAEAGQPAAAGRAHQPPGHGQPRGAGGRAGRLRRHDPDRQPRPLLHQQGRHPRHRNDPEGVTEYLGNYDDYLEKKRLEEAGEDEAAQGGMTRTQLDKEKRVKRLQKESAKALKQKHEAGRGGHRRHREA